MAVVIVVNFVHGFYLICYFHNQPPYFATHFASMSQTLNS